MPAFSITVSGPPASMRTAARGWVSREPRATWVERAPGQDLVVFAADARGAAALRQALEAGQDVDAAVAAAELQGNTWMCHQEDATPGASAALGAFVAWLITAHGPARVTSEPDGADLTATARTDAAALFR